MSAPRPFTPHDWTMFGQFYEFLIAKCEERFKERYAETWDGKSFFCHITEVNVEYVSVTIDYNDIFQIHWRLPASFFISEENSLQQEKSLIE